ncbi:MAG: hypothetical protein ABSG68_01230 [Thermoguttaceae bacterium]
MATIELDNPAKLSPDVQRTLRALRRRIRAYVWWEGLGAAVAWLGVAFWASLVIDWLFEPSPLVRVELLAFAAIVLAYLLIRLIGRRAFVPLSDSNLATILERRFPQLDDSLLTAVVLGQRTPQEAGYNPLMLAHTSRDAARRIAGVELSRVFNPAPLGRNLAAAVLLAGSVALFAVALPGPTGIWASRSLLFSSELWPRKVGLLAVGFTDGRAKVARGADFDLRIDAVKGDTPLPVLPASVEIRYQVEGGPRGRASMGRLGTSTAANVLQAYVHTFRGVLSPIRCDVFGGDAQLRNLAIDVVESPTLIDIQLQRELPAYIGRPKRTLPATAGLMQFPLGTRLVVQAQANKELVEVKVEHWIRQRTAVGVEEDRLIGPPRVLQSGELAAGRRGFSYAVAPMQQDTALVFTLLDVDGIRSREPIRLSFAVVSDAPPQVSARLAGIGTAITPQARLPVAGRVTDDYGIDKIWFEYAIDKKSPVVAPIATLAEHPIEWPLAAAALEVPDLKLAPGQRLAVCLKAADLCTLGNGPNVGSSEVRHLDLVTPEQLNSMLELQQLLLRQRFEAILAEVVETRDLLVRIEFPAAGEPSAKGTVPFSRQSQAIATRKSGQPPGAEPGEDVKEAEKLSPAEQIARRKDRVDQALENGRKNAREVLESAESFDDVRQQIINNRLGGKDPKTSLDTDVVKPLQRIAQEMFPELGRRLESLRAVVADAKLGPPQRELARGQIEAVLAAMRTVLGRMLKLEDFNELVEKLRAIIKLQDQVDQQTKEHHKQGIRDLLD